MYRLPRPVSPMYRLPLTPRFAHAVIYSTTIRGGRAGRLIGQVSRQVMRNGGRPGLDNRTVPSSGGGATPRGPPSRVLPGPCSRSNPYRRTNPWPPCPELPRGPNTTQSPPKPPVPRAHPWPPVPPGSPLASCTGSPGASPFPTGSHVPPQVARFHRGTPSRSNPFFPRPIQAAPSLPLRGSPRKPVPPARRSRPGLPRVYAVAGSLWSPHPPGAPPWLLVPQASPWPRVPRRAPRCTPSREAPWTPSLATPRGTRLGITRGPPFRRAPPCPHLPLSPARVCPSLAFPLSTSRAPPSAMPPAARLPPRAPPCRAHLCPPARAHRWSPFRAPP